MSKNIDPLTNTTPNNHSNNELNNSPKPRVFFISDEEFKILCQADRKGYDPTTGLKKIISMYLSLTGPIDLKELDFMRAQLKAEQLGLMDSP
jgi:hypothetical protein